MRRHAAADAGALRYGEVPLHLPGRSLVRLLHIWWPASLGWSIAVVVRRATGRPWDAAGLAVLLLGILAAYSLDRITDAGEGEPRWMRRLLIAVTVGATVAGGLLLPVLPLASAAVVLVAGLAAALYPSVKRLPLGKTLVVPLVWTWCGIVLPQGAAADVGWRALFAPVALPIFLLFVAGCLLCDLKDAAIDRAAGVPSVPALVGEARATRLAIGVALVAGAIAAVEGRPGLALTAVALSAAGLRPALLAMPDVGPLVVDVILTLPGLLIAARLV